jgi:DNA polymerase-1
VRVILIDAYNVAHIMYHGIKGELDYHGRKTGVIFGFLNRVLQLAGRFETNRFVFAWDSQQSLRERMYPPYKDTENHKKVKVIYGEDEVQDYKALHTQLDELYTTVLTQLGFVNVIRWTGLEADDVIAGVIKHAEVHPAYWEPKPDDWPAIEWIIVSTDRDLYQLLAPDVRIYHTGKKEEYTADDFRAQYGIEPEQWVEAKAIGGCYGDNVAGIEGIADPAKSEKSRALKILKGEVRQGHYVDKVNSELGQFIIERNRQLIKLPFPDSFRRPVILPDLFDRADFIDLFDRLGFTSFLKPERWKKWEVLFELGN